MQNKFLKLLFISIICVLLFCSCWDSRDIQDKDIVTTVVSDYSDGTYSFFIEVASIKNGQRPSQESSSKGSFTILASKGKSFPDARFDLNRKTDSPIFLGANRAIVITDSLAKYGIEEYVNRIRGTIDYRKTTDIITTLTKPQEMLKDQPENDISVGFAIEDTLKTNNSDGTGTHVSIGDVLQAIAVKKAGFFLSQIDLEQGENTLTGYSIFKDAKKIGFIPAKDSMGLVFLHSSKAKFVFDVEYNKNKLTIETAIKKKKITPQFEKGKLKFNLDLQFAGQVLYKNKQFPLDDKIKSKYVQILKDILYKHILDTLKKSQTEFHCDYLEFYRYFRIFYPEEFKTINWNEKYSQAEFKINIKTDIKAAGFSELNPKLEE